MNATTQLTTQLTAVENGTAGVDIALPEPQWKVLRGYRFEIVHPYGYNKMWWAGCRKINLDGTYSEPFGGKAFPTAAEAENHARALIAKAQASMPK